MKKAKIYIPSKTAMQSGKAKNKKWILEFISKNVFNEHLMGWISSDDTQSQVKLEFDSKEEAILYAKNNKIDFEVVEPKNSKQIIKSYADNFLS
jgi:hypothetical protein